jgi:hypothetical protein
MATAGALFMYLADEIGEQARLTQVDLAVAQFFHNHGTSWAVRFFEAITFFGNPSTLGVVGLVTALVLVFQRRWSLLLGWTFALIGAGELNVILKGIFRRLRPQLPDPRVTPLGNLHAWRPVCFLRDPLIIPALNFPFCRAGNRYIERKWGAAAFRSILPRSCTSVRQSADLLKGPKRKE